MAESEILRIEKDALVALLKDEPDFSTFFLDYMLKRTLRVEEDLVDQLFNSSEKRLARALLMLSHFGKEGVPQSVVPKISQETFAEMIGTTGSELEEPKNRNRHMENSGTCSLNYSFSVPPICFCLLA